MPLVNVSPVAFMPMRSFIHPCLIASVSEHAHVKFCIRALCGVDRCACTCACLQYVFNFAIGLDNYKSVHDFIHNFPSCIF